MLRAIGCNRSFFVVGALCLLTSCTDDFSRFRFGQADPAKPDSGTRNVSGSAGTSSNVLGGRGALVDAGGDEPPARGGQSGGEPRDASQDVEDRDD
jgi:hypothetical protein